MPNDTEETITANVPQALAAKIDKIAKQYKQTRRWVVTQALETWIDQEDEHLRMTWEGIADVDAGRVVDHEEVQKWADSLGNDDPQPLPTVS